MHILATDDEQSALNILIGAIQEAVPLATVHGFRSPLEALEFMKETPCEVAFLDIQMREMSGIVLARKLKELYPKLNIIFVTGYSQYANEAFALHASGYVYKPVTADKIVVEMENLRTPVKWKEKGICVNTFGNFEVIVNADHLYFLIDNEIYYENSRVSMTESSLGFTGYNTYRNSKGPDRYGPSLSAFLRKKKYFGCLLLCIKNKE